MAYGLRIINDDNELLIDSDYVNPTFVQKLEFSTTESAGATYGDLYIHPGYTRRYYSTPTVSIGTGKYIVLWALPDSIVAGQPQKDVWYMFPTSVAENNLQFDCSVFSNSNIVGPVSYTLPTAYVFTVDASGVNALSSSGPALRMFNSANQKTFDSNFTQLAPYSISPNFSMPNGTNQQSSSYISTPNNPIYLLPKTALALANQERILVNDIGFRRSGQYIDSKTLPTVREEEGPFPPGFTYFFAGTFDNLSVIVADANLYQASSAGTGGGTNPTYNLSRSVASINEGGSFTITLSTTNVPNGTAVGYNVTGIQQADLSSGLTSGNFTVNNNTATLSFTVANDNLTEGPETFRLEVTTGTFPYIDVTINDTSLSPAAYSISPQTGNVNEGSSITFTVTTTNIVNGTVLYWRYRGGSADPDADFIAYSGSFTITNNSGTFSVTPSADASTEGSETFAIAIATTPTGLEVAYTGTITINDTSLTPAAVYAITPAANNVDEGSSLSFTVSGTNIINGTYYWSINNITTSNADFSDIAGSFNISGNSGSFSIVTTADSATEGAQTFTVTIISGTNGASLVTSSSITINDTSIYPASGTLLNSFCLSYGSAPYTFRQVFANGSGGTYNVDTNNSTTCGYVAPVYNEFITIVSDVGGDYIVEVNGYFTLTIGGGAPNSTFQFAVLNNGDPQPSSYPSSNTLDESGYFVNYLLGSAATGAGTGDKRLWVYFNASGNVRSARVRVVADANTLSGGQYCVGYTLTQNYHDGRGGTYASTVQNNSASCGYVVQYTPVRSSSIYKYYNFDYQGDSWKISGGRPYGPVTATIVNGPYVGFALNGSFNGSGNYVQLIGNYGDLVAGNYTLNFTFPGDDAYYSASYRTLVATFQVVNASAGGGIIP